MVIQSNHPINHSYKAPHQPGHPRFGGAPKRAKPHLEILFCKTPKGSTRFFTAIFFKRVKGETPSRVVTFALLFCPGEYVHFSIRFYHITILVRDEMQGPSERYNAYTRTTFKYVACTVYDHDELHIGNPQMRGTHYFTFSSVGFINTKPWTSVLTLEMISESRILFFYPSTRAGTNKGVAPEQICSANTALYPNN